MHETLTKWVNRRTQGGHSSLLYPIMVKLQSSANSAADWKNKHAQIYFKVACRYLVILVISEANWSCVRFLFNKVNIVC